MLNKKNIALTPSLEIKPRPKSTHDGLTGISARMQDKDVKGYKSMMKRLKEKHGKGFSLSDLIQMITAMDSNLLDKEIKKFKSMQGVSVAFVKKLDISDDAKSRIEAILREEAMKKT